MKAGMSIELLESLHRFPCPYEFKVIGEANERFVARVVSEIREEVQAAFDPPYRIRQSSGGRHVAISIEPVVVSAQQVLAIYSRIGQLEGVVMLI